jgi:hypothetical protein
LILKRKNTQKQLKTVLFDRVGRVILYYYYFLKKKNLINKNGLGIRPPTLSTLPNMVHCSIAKNY